MPILFRAYRTNFNARRDVKVTFEAVDNPHDKREASRILDIPENEIIYIQVLQESEIPEGGSHEKHPTHHQPVDVGTAPNSE